MMAHRGVEAAGGLVFVALVPRLMGPDLYGRYALVTSMALWFALASGLGFVSATTRYVPQLLARDEMGKIRRLVGNFLTLRVASSGIASVTYLVLLAWWWPDLDRIVLGLMSGSVFVQGVAGFLFALFLGFNQAGRWAAGEALRRWVLLALVVPAFQLDGLRGVIIAVLMADVVVLALGVWWTRPWPAGGDLWPNLPFLAPFLRFGLAFLATQWLQVAFQGSGEPLVRAVTGSYTQVGFFGLAQTIYLVAASTLPQLMLAFAPMLSTLLDRGQTAELAQWSARFLKCLAAGGVFVVFGAWFLAGPVVSVVFGDAYLPAGPNLVALSLAVLALTLGSVSSVLALVHERPGIPLGAAAIRLALFWSLGPLLVGHWESLGGCVAMAASNTVHAGYLAWRMRDVGGVGPFRAWLVPVGVGALFLPLGWLRSTSPWDAALYLTFVVGYATALFGLRVVTGRELRGFVSLFRPR
jgi:O-antigen/teichoic acid export membrane protein